MVYWKKDTIDITNKNTSGSGGENGTIRFQLSVS